MVSEAIVGIVALALLFGAVPAVILVGIIMSLKNRRHKVEEHSKLISQMIEKSEGANIDFKAMAEMLNETDSKKKTTKMAVLKHLEYGALSSLVGLFVLLYGVFAHVNQAVIIGGLLLTIGVAFLVMFLVSKNYLKKELEKEEKELAEKE
jgi:Flp pilus assembly protein TadB